MTFNDNADISSGKVSRRGRNGAIIGGAGGGGLLIVGLVILSQVLGVDLTGLADVGTGADTGPSDSLEQCATGADANADLDCRMKGAAAALDDYWSSEAPSIGVDYTAPADFVLFTDGVSTGCGTASSATGPFYCPADQALYVDTAFFAELRDNFGSSGGPLAQMYVVAHEWGHHIQNLAGILEGTNDGDTGPGSATIRTELQADCFAGAWVGDAANSQDENGVTFLATPTQAELDDALSAAAAVGDDRIQSQYGQVNPESWTHGSSDQRQSWFMAGYNAGAGACDTFSPSTEQL